MSRVPNRLILAGVLGVALLLRLPGMFTDLWLDEVWSVYIARIAQSLGDIFVHFPGSDNQHLNSIVLYLMGDQPAWPVYRAHSLVAGLGAVAMAWIIGARRGRLEALLAAVLTATSYLMIHYSSEARGYAMVVFFALAAFHAAERFMATRKLSWAAAVWVCCCLGFLAHLTFLHVFAALGTWLLVRLYRSTDRVAGVRDAVVALGVPTILLVLFYVLVLRHFEIGGAPDYTLRAVLVKTLSYAAGGPATGPMAYGVTALAAILFMAAAAGLHGITRDEWVFFVVVMFASPAVVLLALRPEVLFVRYFLLSIAFAYLASAFLLARWLRQAGPWRIGALAMLCLFLVGNAIQTASLYRHGRGAYLDALRFMVDESVRSPTTVAGDYDFRHSMMIDFYRRYLPADKPIVYVPSEKLSEISPQWYLIHRIGEPGQTPEQVADDIGHPYDKVRAVRYSDLSGWHWYLYKRRPE
jgi:hypothetical protein